MNMKSTFKVSFCGIISALCVVLLLITSVFPFGTYALPCFAGMLLVAIVIEAGSKWAYMAFAVISLLSLFLVSDKEAVVYFITFFGFYPIIKSTLEKIKSKILQYGLKYLIFNICVVFAFFIAKTILMIPDEEFTLFGVYVPWIFLLIGNLFFIF